MQLFYALCPLYLSEHPARVRILRNSPQSCVFVGRAFSGWEVYVVHHLFYDIQNPISKRVRCITLFHVAPNKHASLSPETFPQYTLPANDRRTGGEAILWKGWEVHHPFSRQGDYLQQVDMIVVLLPVRVHEGTQFWMTGIFLLCLPLFLSVGGCWGRCRVMYRWQATWC